MSLMSEPPLFTVGSLMQIELQEKRGDFGIMFAVKGCPEYFQVFWSNGVLSSPNHRTSWESAIRREQYYVIEF